MNEAGTVLKEHRYDFAHITNMDAQLREYENQKAVAAAQREQELLDKPSALDTVLAVIDGTKSIINAVRQRFNQNNK